MSKIKVLIASPYQLVRSALRQLLNWSPHIDVLTLSVKLPFRRGLSATACAPLYPMFSFSLEVNTRTAASPVLLTAAATEARSAGASPSRTIKS